MVGDKGRNLAEKRIVVTKTVWNGLTEAMSEFKFACPVCGQHITADSSTSGGQIQCPTCFQKIIVPQAPASGDAKFILSAAQVGKPRPVSANPDSALDPYRSSPARQSFMAAAVLLLLVGAAGATVFVFREKIFKSSATQTAPGTKQAENHADPIVPRTVYPIPTNFNWTLDLTNVDFPDVAASGSIHGSGFFCERATLTGGNLTMRQGKGKTSDLGFTVAFFAQQGEDLSRKTVEITADRIPPLPRVTLRWKDDQDKVISRNIPNGYALKVVFGEAANGRIPGKLYLCLPDESKSFIAGNFEADIRKPPPPKPKAPTKVTKQ
jgi:DNA-directed RNA polymerase subunit RPC12/RpoP